MCVGGNPYTDWRIHIVASLALQPEGTGDCWGLPYQVSASATQFWAGAKWDNCKVRTSPLEWAGERSIQWHR